MEFKKVVFLLRVFLTISFLILFVRLFELQIIKGQYYKDLADGNRIRKVTVKAPRGEILARGGEYLAKNIPVNMAIYYNREAGYFLAKENEGEGTKISDILGWKRNYPLKDAVGHVTGYLGQVNNEELAKVNSKCVEKGARSISDLIGRSGLEEYYDCMLRGYDGERLLEVTADGTFIRELGEKAPQKGEDLKTTIDYQLQQYVSGLMESQKGGIIVSDPDGEILALYSSPGFDPNIFEDSINEGKNEKNISQINQILNDKNLPIFNRLIAGKYAPGSIFKPLVAVSALESGTIDENYRYQDNGVINFNTPYGNYSYSNWYYTQYGGVEGSLGVVKALSRSTDTFFYKVGELTGVDNIVEWANRFNLSGLSGIDLPGETPGFVPDPNWKEDIRGERWYLGNTYHLSIGQGDLAITPIGIHSAISSIAFGGKICKPHLMYFDFGHDHYICKDLSISEKNLELVKEGMKGVCTDGGTGYTFFDFESKYGVDVACKTGTAQFGGDEKTHAWFTAFAPVDNPQIVVTVLVEEGGEGSKVAGPIARNIFDYWFKDKLVGN